MKGTRQSRLAGDSEAMGEWVNGVMGEWGLQEII